MWHEARKQERLIRGMIVDYRRRAERRKDFYEKIKAEPTQFLQLHGRPCKIHLDPAVAAAGEGPAIMMPWQGDFNNMIDRFDVRAHLDYIQEVKNPDIPPEELSPEERQCNYERYRILAQNAFLGISEDKFLQQLAIEEQFGVTIEEKEAQKEKLNEKKGTGVAIGYNYNDPGLQPSSSNGSEVKKKEKEEAKDSDDDSDLEIIDVDLSIDVNKMEAAQAHELNGVGPQFGMAGCDLFSFLTGDADDAEQQKQLLREEKEKAMFSGRKSRRERRAVRDKKLSCRTLSPPSYAAAGASLQPAPQNESPSRSASRSPTPDGNNIQFITEFGPEDDEVKLPPIPKLSYADKVKQNLKKIDLYSDVVRRNRKRSLSSEDASPRPMIGPRRKSPSRSKSRSRSYSRSRSRSRSRSYRRSRSYSSRSRSRSYSPYRRSRSPKPRSYRRRSTSPNNTSAKRKSRSMSFERESKPSVPRYYGRKKDDKSSSELSVDSDSSENDADSAKNKSAVGNKSNPNQNQIRMSGSSSKGHPSKETLSIKERLKRKMQAQLSRQLRADKRAEQERLERESRRQARRDEEMRELAIKLRRKQREFRHQQRGHSSDDSECSQSEHSENRDRYDKQSPPPGTKEDSRSRSKSKSPAEKRIPVWETNRESPPPYRPKVRDPESHPHYQERRRYNDHYPERPSYEERQYPQNRYERYPNKTLDRHETYNRPDYQHERWDERRNQGNRRPYGHRGGYRGYGNRSGHSEHYAVGPSWQHTQNDDKDSSSENDSKKVKLVDY